MYKASRKSVVVLKGNSQSLFDEAQFILKDKENILSEDITKEANRIIAEYSERKKSGKQRVKSRAPTLSFCFGLFCGIGITLLLLLIFKKMS